MPHESVSAISRTTPVFDNGGWTKVNRGVREWHIDGKLFTDMALERRVVFISASS